MLVILAAAALSASLALLAAHLHLPRVADVLAITAALCGLTAFASSVFFTIRRARQLPSRSTRP